MLLSFLTFFFMTQHYGLEATLEKPVSKAFNALLFLLFFIFFFWFMAAFFKLFGSDLAGHSRCTIICLSVLVVLGVFFRWYGLDYGLPLHLHPDEETNISIGERYQRHPDNLVPQNLAYPSVLYYVISVASTISNGVAALRGERFIISHSSFVYCRFFMSLFSIVIIPLVFLIVLEIGGDVAGGLFSGCVVSMSPLLIRYAHITSPESPLIFFLGATCWLCLRNLRSGTPRWDLAGIAVGFSLGTKYNAAPIVLVLVAALMWACLKRDSRMRRGDVLFTGLMCLVAFLLSTPTLIIDWSSFMNGLSEETFHYISAGHPGYEGQPGSDMLLYYLQMINREGLGAAFTVLAGMGFLVGLVYRPGIMGLLAIVPFIIFYMVCVHFRVTFDRVILPALPFLAIFPGILPAVIKQKLSGLTLLKKDWLWLGLGLLLVYQPALTSYREWTWKQIPETRHFATTWIDQNIPHNAVIGRMMYGPQFKQMGRSEIFLDRTDVRTVAQYRQEGLDYLVLSDWDYNRFLNNPGYAEISARYQRLFFELSQDPNVVLVKTWRSERDTVPGPTLKLYQLKKVPIAIQPRTCNS